jgi:hypothetical protein
VSENLVLLVIRSAAMATDVHKALVRRFVEEYSLDIIDELFVPLVIGIV